MPKFFAQAELRITVETEIEAETEEAAKEKGEKMSAEEWVDTGTITECEYEDVFADALDEDEEDDEDIDGDSDELDADEDDGTDLDAGPLGEGEQR